MTTLRWVDACSLDIPRLDDAHRRLLVHVQEAIDALQHERRPEAARAIDALSEEARHHFHDEELLMRETGYPGYYNHCEQHRRLTLSLEHLQVSLALRPLDYAVAVHDLRAWFTAHLLNHDQPLSTYVDTQHL